MSKVNIFYLETYFCLPVPFIKVKFAFTLNQSLRSGFDFTSNLFWWESHCLCLQICFSFRWTNRVTVFIYLQTQCHLISSSGIASTCSLLCSWAVENARWTLIDQTKSKLVLTSCFPSRPTKCVPKAYKYNIKAWACLATQLLNLVNF